jgi:AcrR family transcriptional regulator
MARPRSDEKRSAIMSAATRVIASEGLGAPTAAIAKEAGVSNGSLFTYFGTKADLLNELYQELKAEMVKAASPSVATEGDAREQMLHVWSNWLQWATSYPEKRRALAHLSVSDAITPERLQTARQTTAGMARLVERSCERGPMHEAPLGFVLALMNAMADTTIDFMVRDPENADMHRKTGFDALWRMLG